jgi:hypothetical protein
MGTDPQEDPNAIREVPSDNLKVGMSRTISAQRITGPRTCYEIENSESYLRLILLILGAFSK